MAIGKKLLIGCLVGAAGVVLLLVALFAAYVAWGVYANGQAEKHASAFCEATHPGEDIARVVERAKGPNPPNRHGNDSDGVYHFVWYGMIYSASECVVATSEGRVVSKKVQQDND